MGTRGVQSAGNMDNLGEDVRRGGHGTASAVVTRREIEMVIDEGLTQNGIVTLCAPAGMGKTVLLDQVRRSREASGQRAISLELGDMEPMAASKSLESAVRSAVATHKGPKPIILVDELPDLDESEYELFSRLLSIALKHGILVVMAIAPRVEGIVDDLPRHMLLRAEQLRVRAAEYRSWFPSAEEPFIRKAELRTHGIPALVDAYCDVVRKGGFRDALQVASFRAAVSRAGRHAVDDCLMDDERRICLAMMQLGRGRVDELEDVGIDVDVELVEGLAEDLPLLGIDPSRSTFGIVEAPFTCWDEALSLHVDLSSSFGLAAARHLCERGAYRDAAHLANMLLSKDAQEAFVSLYAMDLVNCGETDFVGRVVSRAEKNGGKRRLSSGLVLARRFLDSCEGNMGISQAGWEASHSVPASIEGAQGSRLAERLVAMSALEELGKGVSPDRIATMVRRTDDVIARGLLVHVLTRALLVRGRYAEALEAVLHGGYAHGTKTLVACLARLDLALVGGLMGDERIAGDPSMVESARAFAKRFGMMGVMRMADEDAFIVSVFGHGAKTEFSASAEIGRLLKAGCRERACVLMVVQAMHETEWGMPLRAKARSREAMMNAVRLGSAPLTTWAGLVSACACENADDLSGAEALLQETQRGLTTIVGDDVSEGGEAIGDELGATGTINLLLSMYQRCMAGQERQLGSNERSSNGRGLPLAAIPLVDFMVRFGGEAGRRVGEMMPESWARVIERYYAADDLPEAKGPLGGIIDSHGGAELAPTAVKPADATRPLPLEALEVGEIPADETFEVSVLGALAVRACGRMIPSVAWHRKKTSELLELLVATPGHALPRFEIIRELWPDSDVSSARGCLYSNMSELRRVMGDERGTNSFLMTSQGIIQLNPDLVRCDVDEFERLARRTAAQALDGTALMAACHDAGGVYRGDLVVPPCDTSGLFRRRRDELRRLFVDVMVRGARAALSAGMPMDALYFSRQAHAREGVREDVMECLMTALAETGGRVEAIRLYEDYAERVVSEVGLPPSQRLRALYQKAIGRGRGSGNGYVEDDGLGDPTR